ATLDTAGAVPAAVFGSHRLKLPHDLFERRPALRDCIGRSVAIGIRPEAFADATPGEFRESERIAGVCKLREALGSDVLLHFDVDAPPVVNENVKELASDDDLQAVADLRRNATTTFIARVVPQSRVRKGDTFEFAVDVSRLHFFDRTTNESI